MHWIQHGEDVLEWVLHAAVLEQPEQMLYSVQSWTGRFGTVLFAAPTHWKHCVWMWHLLCLLRQYSLDPSWNGCSMEQAPHAAWFQSDQSRAHAGSDMQDWSVALSQPMDWPHVTLLAHRTRQICHPWSKWARWKSHSCLSHRKRKMGLLKQTQPHCLQWKLFSIFSDVMS